MMKYYLQSNTDPKVCFRIVDYNAETDSVTLVGQQALRFTIFGTVRALLKTSYSIIDEEGRHAKLEELQARLQTGS